MQLMYFQDNDGLFKYKLNQTYPEGDIWRGFFLEVRE